MSTLFLAHQKVLNEESIIDYTGTSVPGITVNHGRFDRRITINPEGIFNLTVAHLTFNTFTFKSTMYLCFFLLAELLAFNCTEENTHVPGYPGT